MEDPIRYIAIRPIDVGPPPGAGLAEDGDRIDAIREDLAASAGDLTSIGLERAAKVADIPKDPQQGGFVTLPEFNALFLEPPVGTPKEAMQEKLDESYVVVPNFALSLPETALGDPVAAADVRPILEVLADRTGVRESHESGNRGAGTVVAILDTGCDGRHREFDGRQIEFVEVAEDVGLPLKHGEASDAGTHGTHVTGIAAGKVVGIAPETEVINASVMESETLNATVLRLTKALYWLVELLKEERYKDKPVILNLSLGFDPNTLSEEERKEGLENKLKALHLLIQQLVVVRQILPVVAIGNSGPDTSCAPGFFPESLAVGAVDYEDASWPDSSGGFGPAGFDQECNPDIAGYGVKVVSAVPGSSNGEPNYESKNGTSMATPYVAGIAALVAAKTGLQGLELREHLIGKAISLGLEPARGGAGLARYCL
jgi:subtilisin family serine protease